MKKSALFTVILLSIFTSVHADIRDYYEQQIEMKGKTHFSEWNIPADMPDVYYNNVSGIITIVDYVNATYYVTIIDDWNTVVLTDTKVGGGTIDISSLSTGDYTIDITTSWNHEFTGDFYMP